MKPNGSPMWIWVVASCLAGCESEGGSGLTPVVSSEIAPDGLSYPDPNMFTQGVPITPLHPTVARGTPTNYMVVPDLPAGLRLDSRGVISGTPTEHKAPGTYLVTAGNSAGTSSFGVRITVIGRFTIGGNVSGLMGTGLVLTNNGGDPLAVSENGRFTFSATLGAGASYAVAIATQPGGQTCRVYGGVGAVTNDDVGTVAVTCDAPKAKPSIGAYSLSTVAGTLAVGAPVLIVDCDSSPDARAPRVRLFDPRHGGIEFVTGVLHRYIDPAVRSAEQCGRYATWLAPGGFVHVADTVTGTVMVLAAPVIRRTGR